jgi:CubicO group peptidase (beta-lactamase class C family)
MAKYALALALAACLIEPGLTVGVEAQAAFDAIEPLVRDAISDKKLPGAVVLVGQGERTLYQKAIGQRSVSPAAEPMTLDTIFDLASLTKVVATTTSVMIMV